MERIKKIKSKHGVRVYEVLQALYNQSNCLNGRLFCKDCYIVKQSIQKYGVDLVRC